MSQPVPEALTTDTRRRPIAHNLKTAAVLGVVAGATALLLMPYAVELSAGRVQGPGLPMWLLAVLSFVQTAILTTLVCWAGVTSAQRVGLRMDFVESWIHGSPRPDWDRVALRWVILAGVAAAISIIVLDAWVFLPLMPEPAQPIDVQAAAWKGLLASFYGGITEELLLRLGFLSTLTWLGLWLIRRATGDRQRPPGPGLMWTCILLAALLFGLGHLPATAALWPLTGIVVARALILNGLAGVVFGYIYWRRGLEYAMVGHFSADIVLHVAVPLVRAGWGE